MICIILVAVMKNTPLKWKNREIFAGWKHRLNEEMAVC